MQDPIDSVRRMAHLSDGAAYESLAVPPHESGCASGISPE